MHSGSTVAELLGSIMVNPDGQESHPIVEGDVIEESEDEDRPDHLPQANQG